MDKPTFFQKLRNKPHNLFLFACLILLLISFVVKGENNSLDIHLHDTYFVIGATFFYWLFAIVMWTLWLLYIPLQKHLYSSILTWTHVIISTSIILWFGIMLAFPPTTNSHQFVDYSGWNAFGQPHNLHRRAITFTILILLLLLVQSVFIVNILTGLLKRKPTIIK